MEESQGPAWATALFFFGFFVVMLIVPWIMARQPSDRGAPRAGGGVTPAISGPLYRLGSRATPLAQPSRCAAGHILHHGVSARAGLVAPREKPPGPFERSFLPPTRSRHRSAMGEDEAGPARDRSRRRGDGCHLDGEREDDHYGAYPSVRVRPRGHSHPPRSPGAATKRTPRSRAASARRGSDRAIGLDG